MEEFELEEYQEDKKHYIFIVVLIILFLVSSVGFYIVKGKMKKETKPIEENLEIESDLEETEEKVTYLKADIKGAVKNPGVYEVMEGSRIIDVIEKAGGLLKDANTSLINLSKKIIDEMTIIIYTNEDIDEWRLTDKIKEYEVEEDMTKCPDKLNEACISETNSKEEATLPKESKISLNKGTKEELMTLSGIGESKAEAIIEYRTATPFEKVEDILNIKGIGEAIFEKIKDSITL